MELTNFKIEDLRDKVSKGITSNESWRRDQLQKISDIIDRNENGIIKALQEDLGKPTTEANFEIISIRQELKIIGRSLSNWMKPTGVNVPLWLKPGEASVVSEPLGCILIIGAWNYPFMLTILPLISALAAGNTAVLKPSEYSPATSRLIEKIFQEEFPKDIVRVLQGDGLFTQELISQQFDHIFFTGGSKIGQKVMTSAAKYLTPVTLELGGSNPALAIEGADIEITAKRLIWGKSINSGQTCLAPNYLLVQKKLRQELIKSMKLMINNLYGDEPENSEDMASINNRQFDKVVRLIESARNENKIIHGGNINFLDRKISPTLLKIDNYKDPIISTEIFGPIIPILSINNLEDAFNIIRNFPKPLAIYMFGGTKSEQKQLIQNTSSGSICFNDVIIQAGIPELPFGGVGLSGTGRYHGKSGFETFSNHKSILNRPFWMDLRFRYPPYNLDISFMNKLIK